VAAGGLIIYVVEYQGVETVIDMELKNRLDELDRRMNELRGYL